ncbi:MAG: hypothetical protein KBD17_00465 [Candidatus Pacebacteria bacterium]|nr:hypothetical protein [Candidatus Paceibacterota bacterium]
MKDKDDLEKNIDEIKEWQNEQFNPGHFLGGNIPPYLLRKNKKLGVLLLVIGFFQLILMAIGFAAFDIGQIVLFLIITLLMIFAGYSKLKGN